MLQTPHIESHFKRHDCAGGIRGIGHTDYKSTCAKLALFGLEVAE